MYEKIIVHDYRPNDDPFSHRLFRRGRQQQYQHRRTQTRNLNHSEQGGSYQIMKNDVETKCGIMFTNYTSEGIKKTNISLVIADYNDNDSMQAYVLCASIIMYEGDVDGNYDTFKAAKDAFVEFGSNIETNPVTLSTPFLSTTLSQCSQ